MVTPFPSKQTRTFWALFRTHLGVRLMAMFVGVALLPMALVAVLGYQQARASLVNLALSKVEQEAGLTAKDMETYLGQFSADVLALSAVPEVQGIIRAADHAGTDPVTHETYVSWIDRLRQIFASIARGKLFYRQLVYLNEHGDEIVRIDYQDEMVTVASDDARLGVGLPLQKAITAPYFTEAQKLRARQVFISPVTLITQTGQTAPAPTLYLSTPIYDEAQTFRGVVTFGVYANSFLNRLKVSHGQIYLADQSGFYLAHPDPARAFTTANVAADFPIAYRALQDANGETHVALESERREVVALRKFHFDARQPEHYWLLVRSLPEKDVLGPVNTLGFLTLTMALLSAWVVALLAYRLARGFTGPIRELTGIAEQISQTDLPQLVASMGQVAEGKPAGRLDLSAHPVAVKTEDEVGQLGAAFNRMMDSLHEAQLRLLSTQEQLRRQKDAAAQAAAQAAAANRAKSVFLATMSHELRTPLNAILGYADILKRRPGATGPLVDGLDIIQKSGEHLLTLINDVLDLAKIEAGKLELNPTPIQLPGFLRQIVDIVRARAEAKELTLAYEALSPLPDTVLTDEKRLRQVLLNLLGNAVKFTERGHVTLRLSQVPPQSNGRVAEPTSRLLDYPITQLVRFEVEDSGVGIAPEQLERIFQPFEQAGEAGKRAEGAGLGLAISQQIVQLMGSHIQVKSPAFSPRSIPPSGGEVRGGTGSLFWFEVALPVLEPAAPEEPSPVRDIAGYEGPRRKVLVVDDKAYNRLLLVDMLEPLGFELNTASDGQQAVDKALEWRPDAIVMDMVMPVKTGLEATQEIRQQAELGEVPIIAVSASVLEADQEKSRAAGCNAFLPKPINLSRLLDTLAALLGLSWIYVGLAGGGQSSLLPPPAEELAALHKLASAGRIMDIQKQAKRMEEMGEAYIPFARKLQELAGRFEIEQIKTFVEQFIKEV